MCRVVWWLSATVLVGRESNGYAPASFSLSEDISGVANSTEYIQDDFDRQIRDAQPHVCLKRLCPRAYSHYRKFAAASANLTELAGLVEIVEQSHRLRHCRQRTRCPVHTRIEYSPQASRSATPRSADALSQPPHLSSPLH